MRGLDSLPKIVIATLASLLSDADPVARSIAASALSEFGPAAAAAVPALMTGMCQERDLDTLTSMGRAVHSIGPVAKRTPAFERKHIRMLLDIALLDEDDEVRTGRLSLLALFGDQAIDELVKIARTKSDF